MKNKLALFVIVFLLGIIQWISLYFIVEQDGSAFRTSNSTDLQTIKELQDQLAQKTEELRNTKRKLQELKSVFSGNGKTKLDAKKPRNITPFYIIPKEIAEMANAPCDALWRERRTADPGNCTFITLPKNTSIHPYFKTQVDRMILEEDLDCFYDTNNSAAILYLGPLKHQTLQIHGMPKNRTDIMMVSLKRLHKYHNSAYHYPIFIFHEDYTKEDIQTLRTQFGHPLHFIRVDFKPLPTCADNPEFDVWLKNASNEKNTLGKMITSCIDNLGYRQMCRFWSGIAQNAPVLSSFDYYLRLDDETMFIDWVNFDLFEYATKYNKTYIYNLACMQNAIEFLTGQLEMRVTAPTCGEECLTG